MAILTEAPVTLEVAKNNRKFVNIPKEVFEKMSSLGFDDIGKGGYTNWVLDKYLKSDEGSRSRFVEDLYKVADSLKEFNVKKNKGFWKDPKDINQYKTIRDLESTTEKYADVKAKNEFNVSSKDVSEEDVDTIYDDGTWSIKVPKTREASCVLGRGTKWCTASQGENNMFDEYSGDGPLYVIANKNDTTQKYQLSVMHGQFMNVKDKEIGIEVPFPNFSDGLVEFILSIPNISNHSLSMVHRILDSNNTSFIRLLFNSEYFDTDKDLWSWDNVVRVDDTDILKKIMKMRAGRFSSKFLELVFYNTEKIEDILAFLSKHDIRPSSEEMADALNIASNYAFENLENDNNTHPLKTLIDNGAVPSNAQDMQEIMGLALMYDYVSETDVLFNHMKTNDPNMINGVFSEAIDVMSEVLIEYLLDKGMKPTTRQMSRLIDNFPEDDDIIIKAKKNRKKIVKESYYSFINSYLTESLI